MANSPIVDCRNCTKTFGSGNDKVVALDDVSVTIEENEFFTLLGPSGCGKTTLLRLIAGFELPTSGTILLGDEDISALPAHQRPVNTVFQNYALFPHMTVSENISFGLEMLGQDKQQIKATVEKMLTLVRMEALAGRRTNQLSGGQQQRVALARALAPHPKVLLLDEPLSALDFKLRKDMQIELKRLQTETGITFIFVTHDQEEALTMSDRIAVMEGGRILQVGEPKDIYNHPARRFVADFIGDINILTAELVARDGSQGTVRLPGGKTRIARLPDTSGDRGEVHVAVRPEHAVLVPDETPDAVMSGVISNVVYFGTGTHYHLELEGQVSFVVRTQSSHDASDVHAVGDRLWVALPDNTLQVLSD